MTMIRQPASNMTVFDLATSHFITAVENATFVAEVKDEDAAGVHDLYEFAWATKGRWSIEVDAFVQTIADFIPLVGTSVAVIFNTGGGTYSGSVLITRGSHEVKRDSLQREKIVLKGQGTPTLA